MPKSTDRRARNDLPDTPRAAEDLEGLSLDALTTAALPEGLFILDSDLRIVYGGPAFWALFGCRRNRARGQDLLALFHERDRQTVRTHLADVRNGRSEPLLGVGYGADGSELEVEVRATVLELQGKQVFIGAVRDMTERQRQARQAAALAQAATGVAAGESIDAVLEAICESALAGTRALAAWVKLDDENDVAGWMGAAGIPDGFRQQLRSAACQAAARFVNQEALAARPVVVYADWRQQVERALGMPCPLNLSWQTAAFARLLYRGEAVGLLTAIYREGEVPYAAETTFLAALAAQAAPAAANARLLAAAREKVALEERQRLAWELHDSVSQSLYAIQLGAQMARERLDRDPAGATQPIDYVLRLAEAGLAEMRALIFELRPEALETEGLVAALNRRIEAVRARQGVSVRTIACVEPELPIEVKQELHRIGQEALWNTVKHAQARRVDVSLDAEGDSVVLEIADDGIGFDPSGSFAGHLGLRSMHERAIRAGGSLEVVSARGQGTRVVVRVPLAPPIPLPPRASFALPSVLRT